MLITAERDGYFGLRAKPALGPFVSIRGFCLHFSGFPPMPESNNLLFRDEVHRIVGCSMEVLNTLGHGLLEKPYENSLTVEFGLQGMKPANGFR